MNEGPLRRCGHCGQEQPAEAFPPTHRWCRACKRVWERAWNAAHVERRREIARQSWHRRRAQRRVAQRRQAA